MNARTVAGLLACAFAAGMYAGLSLCAVLGSFAAGTPVFFKSAAGTRGDVSDLYDFYDSWEST